MSNRLVEFVAKHLTEGASEYDIAAGISNGDITIPDWINYGDTAIGFALWDTAESNGSLNLYDLDTRRTVCQE